LADQKAKRYDPGPTLFRVGGEPQKGHFISTMLERSYLPFAYFNVCAHGWGDKSLGERVGICLTSCLFLDILAIESSFASAKSLIIFKELAAILFHLNVILTAYPPSSWTYSLLYCEQTYLSIQAYESCFNLNNKK